MNIHKPFGQISCRLIEIGDESFLPEKFNGTSLLTDSNAEILNGDTDDDGVGAATEPHNAPISSHVLVRPLATRGQAQEPCSFIIPVKTWFNGTRNSSPFE